MRIIYVFAFLIFLSGPNTGYAKEECLPIRRKPVKVEAWISKKFEKDYKIIRREFAELGDTKVGLFVYPSENPSRVVAIGRCVPAFLAQHFIKKAWKYSLGTTHLVHQGFISSHWAGVGTSLFSKNSMSAITPKQLDQLMDETLDTESFQAMYRSLTVQKEKVPAFGLMLENPKLMRNSQQQ